MNTVPAYLIGIDPPEDLKKEIYRLKNRVLEVCGEQQQVNEPPHCTFVVNNFSGEKEIDETLRKLVQGISPFYVDVNGITYFPPEQSGFYMVHASIRKTGELEKLQKRIVTDTSGFRQGSLLQEYLKTNVPAYKCMPEELANLERYGFPYVGKNWKPHISIAILDTEAFDKVGEELTKTELNYRFFLREIVLFGYENKWKPLRTYRFE